jgi:hypothetical protein
LPLILRTPRELTCAEVSKIPRFANKTDANGTQWLLLHLIQNITSVLILQLIPKINRELISVLVSLPQMVANKMDAIGILHHLSSPKSSATHQSNSMAKMLHFGIHAHR